MTRNLLITISLLSIFFLPACSKKPEAEKLIINEFIPPITELKYENFGSYYYGFGNWGFSRFSTASFPGEFHVIVTKTNYFGPTATENIYTYKYNVFRELLEIERNIIPLNKKVSIRLFYDAGQLDHFEEWEDGQRLKTFTISYEQLPEGRKMSINKYVVNSPTGVDTLEHSLQFNNAGRVVGVYERKRTTGATPSLVIDNHRLAHLNNEDHITTQGYSIARVFNSNTYDSTLINYFYNRPLNEDPVLADYLYMLYGKEFYSIINYLNYVGLLNFSFSHGDDLLKLGTQKFRSESSFQYTRTFYSNGIFNGTSTGTINKELTFDAQNRLVKSKHTNPLTGNYYTWEIVYK